MLALIAIGALAAAAVLIYVGVASQPQPVQELHSIVKDGVEYVFTSNIYDAAKVPLYDEERIFGALTLAPRVWMLFRDGADNSHIAIASAELASKLAHYYAYTQGRIVNITGVELSQIGNRTLAGTFIEFRGPAAGANETSVSYKSGRILVQAANASDLRLAADRLALVLFEDELAALNVTLAERAAQSETASETLPAMPEPAAANSSNRSGE